MRRAVSVVGTRLGDDGGSDAVSTFMLLRRRPTFLRRGAATKTGRRGTEPDARAGYRRRNLLIATATSALGVQDPRVQRDGLSVGQHAHVCAGETYDAQMSRSCSARPPPSAHGYMTNCAVSQRGEPVGFSRMRVRSPARVARRRKCRPLPAPAAVWRLERSNAGTRLDARRPCVLLGRPPGEVRR